MSNAAGLRWLLVAMAISNLMACTEYYEPYASYGAKSDPARMYEIAEALEGVWAELGLVRHDFLVGGESLGSRTEFRYYVFKDDMAYQELRYMLSASVYATHVRLSFNAPERGGMPAEALDLVVDEVKSMLESRFGLLLCRENPFGGACDDEYARREAARWTSVRPDAERGYAPRAPFLQYRARYDPGGYDPLRPDPLRSPCMPWQASMG